MDGFQDKQAAKCIDNQDKLTEWEAEFIDSIIDRDKPLSHKQASILNRITQKVEFG